MNTLLPWETGNVFQFEYNLQDFEVKGQVTAKMPGYSLVTA